MADSNADNRFADEWDRDGPSGVVSAFMEANRGLEDLSPDEKSLVAFSFAIEGWTDEAIEAVEALESPTVLGKRAKGRVLEKEEKLEEAIEAYRESLRIESSPYAKYDLAMAIRSHLKRQGVGAYVPAESDSEKLAFVKHHSNRTHHDYRDERYDEVKSLLRECIDEVDRGSSVLGWYALDLAKMAGKIDEGLDVLREAAQRGSGRAAFELAVSLSYYADSGDKSFLGGIRWSEVTEKLAEEPAIEESEDDIFQLYVRFAALIEAHNSGETFPERFFDYGMELLSEPGQLDAKPEEVALHCGRAAVVSDRLSIARMFYERVRESSGEISEGVGKLEAEGLRAKRREGQIEKILEASQSVLEQERGGRVGPGTQLVGIRPRLPGDLTSHGHMVEVTNFPLMWEVERIDRSKGVSETRGVASIAAAEALVATGERREKHYQWENRVRRKAALEGDHEAASSTRSQICLELGLYGHSVVEDARSTAKVVSTAEEVEEKSYRFMSGRLRDVLEAHAKGEEPELPVDIKWDSELKELARENGYPPREKAKQYEGELFERSFRDLRDFVRGESYKDEISEDLRIALATKVCLGWEIIGRRSPPGVTWKEEASRVMRKVGTPDGKESEQEIWARGTILRQESMVKNKISDRSKWMNQKEAFKKMKAIGLGWERYALAELGRTCNILGDHEEARKWLLEVEEHDREEVNVDVQGILQLIDRLKTAPDRWADLGYYPKKLAAALTVLEGDYTTSQIADLAGQKKKFIGTHLQTLVDQGMLERSGILGPINIEDFGTVRVNPYIEENAQRERTHELQSRIVEAESNVHARPVFDSEGEHKIYQTLTEIFPNGLVFPNMSPSAIFKYDEMKEVLESEEFTYFLQSRVDFCVVSTETYLPIVGIEVDSHYHDQEEQKARDEKKDKIFRVGGVPLVRLRRRGDLSRDAVASQLREKMQDLIETESEEAALLRVADLPSKNSSS